MNGPQFSDLLKKCTCIESKNNILEFPEIRDIVPVEHKYTICDWVKLDEEQFECRFRVNISTKEAALDWIEEFCFASNTFYTKEKTFPGRASNVYKVVLKCHHNTRPKNSYKKCHPKNTGCPARLIVTVKQTVQTKYYESTDVHLQDFPMIVIYRSRHNHGADADNAFKFKFPSSDEEDIFIKYFERGLTPSQAMEEYSALLRETYKDDFKGIPNSLCPDKRWIYHLYYQIFKKEFSDSNGEIMLHALELYIAEYNNQMKGEFAIEMKRGNCL